MDYFTGKTVYDGERIILENVKPVDLSEIGSYADHRHSDIDYALENTGFLKVRFTTPIEVEKVPFSLNHLIYMIRQRLIFFVNEYGEGVVPSYICEDMILNANLKRHRLTHTSKRLGKREFIGYTGDIEYKVIEMDFQMPHLLGIGRLIGAGAKSSFGMGFFEIET
jgi:CRISPR/Cas system endoribonuclease Cas6 (RAMP superfamily)